MTDFKHGVKYDISKHTPPEGVLLQVWRGDFTLAINYRVNGDMWSDHWEQQTHVNLFVHETGATHFSLWPEEEETQEPPTARDVIVDALELCVAKFPKCYSGQIIDHLSRNGYEITRKDDKQDDVIPLTDDDKEYLKSWQGKAQQFSLTKARSILAEQIAEKPKSWEQYLDEDGDFPADDIVGGADYWSSVYIEKPKIADSLDIKAQQRALIAWLNHHLKETK